MSNRRNVFAGNRRGANMPFYPDAPSVPFYPNGESSYYYYPQDFAPNNGYQGNGYQGNGYQNNGYQGNGYRSNGYQNQPKKKSGAVAKLVQSPKNGQVLFISAWFYRKNTGIVQIRSFENSASTHSTSGKGNEFVTMMFEVFYKNSGIKRLEVGNYNITTGKVLLNDTGIIISTKANNGGYCGYYQKRR